MLIVSNGAFKSGSTWLTYIAGCMVDATPIPSEFRRQGWVNDAIAAEDIPNFLRAVDIGAADYLIKSHYRPKSDLRSVLLSRPEVRVLNIYRDPKDVVVSAYFHYRRAEDFEGTMDEFFAEQAPRLVRRLVKYHLYWDCTGAEEAIFFTTYEKLHTQFDEEVSRLASFLGRPLPEGKIAEIRERTGFSQVREATAPDDRSFFRKGVLGDWQNHLSPAQAAKVDETEQAGGIDRIRHLLG